MLQNTDQHIDKVIKNYPVAANRLNMTLSIKLTNNETVLIGHGAHEVMHNNPFFKSHLVGNGGENVYVITSGNQTLNTEKFPIPEIVIYDVDKENSTDTIDLRNVIKSAKEECHGAQISPKINAEKGDLIITLYSNLYFSSGNCINLSSEFLISSIVLKGALLNEWYKKLHVVLNNAPMEINVDNNRWDLKPLSLVFDKEKEIIIITPNDVEEKNELIIPRKVGGDNLTFAYLKDDLIITNAFARNVDICTILFKDFYRNAKIRTLVIRFIDKEILLSNEAKVYDAISYDKEIEDYRVRSNQIYNEIFNHTRSENISLGVNETTTHEIRHTDEYLNITEHQRSRRAIKEVPNISINDNLEFFVAQNNATTVMKDGNNAGHISDIVDQQSSSYAEEIAMKNSKVSTNNEDTVFFVGRNNATFNMGNDGTSSAATRIGSKINDLFSWVKSSIGGLFNYRAALPENNTTLLQVDAQVNVDGTILLLDVFIRKITGQKFVPSANQSISLLEAQGYALSITEKFETLLTRTARSCGIQDNNSSFNPVTVQSAIVGQIRNNTFSEISKALYLSAKEAYPEFNQTGKFLAQLKSHLEEMVAEKETVLIMDKQNTLTGSPKPRYTVPKYDGVD